MLDLILLCAADSNVGFGHLSRCVSIARSAERIGFDVRLFVMSDENINLRTEDRKLDYVTIKSGEQLYAEWCGTKNCLSDLAIVDLAHEKILETDIFVELTSVIRRSCKTLAFIDSLEEKSVKNICSDAPLDVLILPYQFEPIADRIGTWRVLQGVKYAVLAPEYANLTERVHRHHANRLLLSCGGADPKDQTIKIVSALNNLDRDLEIRIVLGPMLSDEKKSSILRVVDCSKHKIETLDSPLTLLDHMLWCDIAISASGLTKYELAASETPSILFSIDSSHDQANREFAKTGVVVDFGYDFSYSSLAEEADRLLLDFERRVKISSLGRRLVDGLGVRRLLSNLTDEKNVEA